MKHNFNSWRFLAIVGLLAPLLLASLLAPTGAGAAYDCGDMQNGHCYSINRWTGTRGAFIGGDTTMYVASLNAGPNSFLGLNSFINNEMWISDTHNPGCPANDCWVEVGYQDRNTDLPWYFWSDQRPGGGYNNHYVRQIPDNEFGGWADLSIARDPNDATRWNVMIRSQVPGGTYTVQQSAGNSMLADTQDIGMELAGRTGQASAPTATFTYNRWIWYWNGSDYVKPYQTSNGILLIGKAGIFAGPPPYAQWAYTPSNSQVGGTLWTWCC
jgi:hypothetical protein